LQPLLLLLQPLLLLLQPLLLLLQPLLLLRPLMLLELLLNLALLLLVLPLLLLLLATLFLDLLISSHRSYSFRSTRQGCRVHVTWQGPAGAEKRLDPSSCQQSHAPLPTPLNLEIAPFFAGAFSGTAWRLGESEAFYPMKKPLPAWGRQR
jgi:hypothetical protein